MSIDFDGFEEASMDLELAEDPKGTEKSPHKGRRPSAASTKVCGRLRRPHPFVDILVWAFFRALGGFGLQIYQNLLRSMRIYYNISKAIKIY